MANGKWKMACSFRLKAVLRTRLRRGSALRKIPQSIQYRNPRIRADCNADPRSRPTSSGRRLMVKSIVAIAIVYLIAVVGWITLAGTITYRTDHQDTELKSEIGRLWGTPLDQRAPWASIAVDSGTQTERPNISGNGVVYARPGANPENYDAPIAENDIRVGFRLDQRQKGLLWYSTYRVRFSGDYVFENPQNQRGALTVKFAFPAANGQYDDFKF